jgi:hypothetical protein
MKRVVFGTAMSVVFAVVVASLSLVWLVWFVATMLAVAIYRWKLLPEAGRKLAAVLMALCLVAVMWLVGAAPTHLDPGSSAQTRLPLVSSRMGAPPAYVDAQNTPQLDELAQAREDLRREVFRLRAQSNAVEAALSLKGIADGAIAYLRSAEIPTDDLLNAKRSLNDALASRKLDSVAKLDQTKADLDAFLDQAEVKMANEPTVSGARRLLTDFLLQAREKSIDDVNDSMLQLEDALNRVAKSVIGDELQVATLYRVRLDESSNTLVREELISISARKFPLKTIDASELLLDRGADAITQDLLVYFGDDEAGARSPADVHHIPIRAGIEKVTLLKRTVVPAGLTELATKFRLTSFRYFLLKWPSAFAAKLRVVLDLSPAKLSPVYPYSIETSTDALIKEIRLPKYSLFNAGIAYKTPRREGEEDVLETEEPLRPAYFLTHNSIWVELMPDSIAFRNKPVQEWKQYLFPENLAAALVVMALGFLCTLLIT